MIQTLRTLQVFGALTAALLAVYVLQILTYTIFGNLFVVCWIGLISYGLFKAIKK